MRPSTQALLRTCIKTHMKLYVNIILGIIRPELHIIRTLLEKRTHTVTQAASLVIAVGVHERREGRYPSARILSRKALMTMLMRTPLRGFKKLRTGR